MQIELQPPGNEHHQRSFNGIQGPRARAPKIDRKSDAAGPKTASNGYGLVYYYKNVYQNDGSWNVKALRYKSCYMSMAERNNLLDKNVHLDFGLAGYAPDTTRG